MNYKSALLKQRQSLPLAGKVAISLKKIREWYNHWEGEVYVSYSGGKDSTVLLHMVRSLYPGVPAVFCDTGLEFPEIKEFVRDTPNTITIRPKVGFKQVIEKYGYPIISKETACYIDQIRKTKSERQRRLRMEGKPRRDGKGVVGKIAEKWKFLLDAPFRISDRCCYVMKKNPFHKYEKDTGKKGFVGTMVFESFNRRVSHQKYGCNAFALKNPQSRPLSFWLEEDIWHYIRENQLEYCKIYDKGYKRTGCVFCGFGAHLEPSDLFRKNRYQLLAQTHPKLHEYCMETLGFREVLEYIKVKYK
ncbi:MAG: phosphoadenosine phosphosulfate reductase family protein [Candidatus Aminicenantes bacterium]|nr:phosphoadenosine phosphosulfate reductase family protein [Candidatus Aminicenantes bacterium]